MNSLSGTSPAVPAGSQIRRPNRPGKVLGWFALAAALGLLAHATRLLLLQGSPALRVLDWSTPEFFATSAVPALLLAPVFSFAFHWSRRIAYHRAGLWLAWGIFLLSLVWLIPRGVHSVGWYSQPLIILVVTCMFGAIPGLAQSTLTVAALLLSAWLTAQGTAAGIFGVSPWIHAAVVGSVVIAMALCGAILHRTLDLAISVEEFQNHRMDEARRALRHRENLLRHAMRIDTVGEMSSMVVHQLRNQFQLIMGHAALGLRSDDEEAARSFQSIVDTLEQSNELLESLLGMARRDGSGVETVDLTSLCEQVCANYRKVLPAQISLAVELPADQITAMLDPQGLEHSLLNLVINARQAIRERGTIRISLRRQDSRAVLEVTDTGQGILAENLDRVFQPFFTTKDRGKGTGLGLAAVQRFAKSSNGDVHVHSEAGVGTTFSLVFPLLAGSQAV